MEYSINDILLSYTAEGERKFGEEKILLKEAIDLTHGKVWSEKGFTIENLFAREEYRNFLNNTLELLTSCWKAAGLSIPENFNADQYHRLVTNQNQHMAAVDKTKLLSIDQFPGGIEKIESRISEICGVTVQARNPYDKQSVFHFRVVRPLSSDNNPLHRDVWLEDYESCINLYVPVAGSNERSSLILIPGSHHWSESRIERTIEGAKINGTKFNVPAVTGILGSFAVERPNPGENQMLVFSPYLVHGGAVNLNTDKSRISIELRLWKK